MWYICYVLCGMVVKLAVFLGRQVSDMKLHTQKKVERRKYKKLNYSTTLWCGDRVTDKRRKTEYNLTTKNKLNWVGKIWYLFDPFRYEMRCCSHSVMKSKFSGFFLQNKDCYSSAQKRRYWALVLAQAAALQSVKVVDLQWHKGTAILTILLFFFSVGGTLSSCILGVVQMGTAINGFGGEGVSIMRQKGTKLVNLSANSCSISTCNKPLIYPKCIFLLFIRFTWKYFFSCWYNDHFEFLQWT